MTIQSLPCRQNLPPRPREVEQSSTMSTSPCIIKGKQPVWHQTRQPCQRVGYAANLLLPHSQPPAWRNLTMINWQFSYFLEDKAAERKEIRARLRIRQAQLNNKEEKGTENKFIKVWTRFEDFICDCHNVCVFVWQCVTHTCEYVSQNASLQVLVYNSIFFYLAYYICSVYL